MNDNTRTLGPQRLGWLCGEMIACLENGDSGFHELAPAAKECALGLGYELPPVEVLPLHRDQDVHRAPDLWSKHPDCVFLEVIRMADPVGGQAKFVTHARIPNDGAGMATSRAVSLDLTEEIAAMVRILRQWVRWCEAAPVFAEPAREWSSPMPKVRIADLLGLRDVRQLDSFHGDKLKLISRKLWRIDMSRLDAIEREKIENAPPPPKGRPRGAKGTKR